MPGSRFCRGFLDMATSVYERKDGDDMTKTTYALSDQERDAELKALVACQEALKKLRSVQRRRILDWLYGWTNEEDPNR